MFRWSRLPSLVFILLCGTSLCAAQAGQRRQTTTRLNTLLRLELLAMEEADQKARQKATALPDIESNRAFEDVNQLDRKHTARLREIIRQFGWPSATLVGADGAAAAFLIVQHSPSLKLQKRCLPFIRAAARNGDLSMRDVALLTDRVLIREGKPQVYGTQFRGEGGRMIPYPIASPRGVDARRATVGLPPLAEYVRMLEEVYRVLAKDKAP